MLNKNFKVRILDNLSGSTLKNLDHIKKSKIKIFQTVNCSISKKSKIFKNVDIVFHLAGKGDIVPSIENPHNYINTNVMGTLNVLEASRYAKLKNCF